MNKLIQELALQAKLGPALLLHHYGKVDALTNTEQDELEQIEKFAELIVRECCSVLEQCVAHAEHIQDYEAREVFRYGAIQIEEHFGVEQ